jgi:hypothetical protein
LIAQTAIFYNVCSLGNLHCRNIYTSLFQEGGSYTERGEYTVDGSGDDKLYTFTATDNSKAFIFKHVYKDELQWCIATYPIIKDRRFILLDEAAANDVLSQLWDKAGF